MASKVKWVVLPRREIALRSNHYYRYRLTPAFLTASHDFTRRYQQQGCTQQSYRVSAARPLAGVTAAVSISLTSKKLMRAGRPLFKTTGSHSKVRRLRRI